MLQYRNTVKTKPSKIFAEVAFNLSLKNKNRLKTITKCLFVRRAVQLRDKEWQRRLIKTCHLLEHWPQNHGVY